MTPAARLQAAIEILNEVIASVREEGPPADAIVTRYFKTRRYAGSKDRRAVRELAFRAIRRTAETPPSGSRKARSGQEQPERCRSGWFRSFPRWSANANGRLCSSARRSTCA